MRHHGDRRTGAPFALADGEVQIFDIRSEVLFQSERHDLREFRAAPERQHRLSEERVRARNENEHPASGGQRCSVRRIAGLNVAATRARAVHDEPFGRRRVRRCRRKQANDENFGHQSVP